MNKYLFLILILAFGIESAYAQQQNYRELIQRYCGDGVCQRWEKIHGLCPQDCEDISEPQGTYDTPDGVPAEYQALYAELENKLEVLDRQISAKWSGTRYPVAFAATVIPANSNRGNQLLAPQTYEFCLDYIDRLKEMGLKAVSLDINFPLLFAGFHKDKQAFLDYLDFYKRLAEDIRKRNLKLIVESTIIFTSRAYSSLSVKEFYEGLSFEEYKAGRSEMLKTIATEIRPDYLTIANEPDTEQNETGQPVNDLNRWFEMVNVFIKELRSLGILDMQIGAGMGTWQREYQSFATRLAKQAGIDFIDIHIYPVNRDFFERAYAIADIAKASGKGIALGEAWLYKVQDKELGHINYVKAYARDGYSFWQPLDERFLELLVKLAHCKQFLFAVPFWSQYFFGYTDYNQATADLPYQQLQKATNRKAAANIRTGEFSQTGKAYGKFITSQ